MADATLQHDTVQHGLSGEYEAPLFGAYSKKVGMWLFLASDSLTFGAHGHETGCSQPWYSARRSSCFMVWSGAS